MENVIKVENKRTGDHYYQYKHPSGLNIIIYPKTKFRTTYAMFGTKYGSIDICFKKNGEEKVTKVPAGIAHFLEHKLFESEDGDAFARYAAIGASANAYTSFESTCYLFSTTQNVYDALTILLDFVQSPYFTDETVNKEMGIIGQEIRMYDDDPSWRVMFNMLEAMYHKHPIKVDIAGTTESIAEITPQYLYDCYNTFYNLNNMSLVIAGNIDHEYALSMCDKMLKVKEPITVERVFDDEPAEIVKPYVEEKLSVAMPLFQFGYKEDASAGLVDEKTLATTEILLEILASESSELFKRLSDAELVNEASFSYEFFEGEGYSSIMFGGESRDPKRVAEEIKKEVAKFKAEGIPADSFEICKKSLYGTNISGLNSASNIANAITSLGFKNREIFTYIDSYADITLKDVEDRLQELMQEDKAVLSVVFPDTDII